MPTRHGPQVFSLTGNGAHRGDGMTRRQRANAALIRHRQKRMPECVAKGEFKVWEQYTIWQLEWENAILRYRDGNNNGEDND